MKSELKWNLLFYTALGLYWGSFIRGDTLKILTWKLNGDLLYASHDGRFQARMPRARAWTWMSWEVRTAPQEPALRKCWAILLYAVNSVSSWLFTASRKSNGCLRSPRFLCPPQLLHAKDLAFQPSPSSKSILELRQTGLLLLLQPCGKHHGEYLWAYLNQSANERHNLSTWGQMMK